MSQAKVIDIHRYYRTGGVDWPKLKANADAVIISAGVGMSISPLLREQVDAAIQYDIPYMTYLIPSPSFPMKEQASNYLSAYGVKEAWTCADLEPPSSNVRCVDSIEAAHFVSLLTQSTSRAPLIYSNPSILDTILHLPTWIMGYKLWMAQWLYEFWLLRRQYTRFETFLAKNSNLFPYYVRAQHPDLIRNTVLWQFSCKGDAQSLCASAFTGDPVYRTGLKEADLNISTISRESFLALLGALAPSPEPPPPPPPQAKWYDIPVPARNIRRTPNSITGTVVLTLHTGDKVLVGNITSGIPGQWGQVLAYHHAGLTQDLSGWIYLNSLISGQAPV